MKILNKKEVKLFFTFFIVYIVFINFFEWNEISIVDASLAIAYDNKFEIDRFLEINQLKTGDISYFKGHHYSDKAPGLPLIEYPIVKLYKFFFGWPEGKEFWILIFLMTSLTSSLFTALTCVLLYKISRFFTKKEKFRILISFLYGFGSIAFYYATSIKVHATATFFSFLCFYLLFKVKYEKNLNYKYIFLSGIAGGIAVLTEYQSILIIIFCFILTLTLKRTKLSLYFLLGFLPFILILFIHNYAIYDNPLGLSYLHHDSNVFSVGKDIKWHKLLSLSYYYSKPTYQITRLIDKLIRMQFSPYSGIFIYTPFLLLSFIGLYYMYKKYRLEALSILALFFLYLLFFANSLFGWWGTTGYGNRYFLIITPFLIIPFLYIFKKVNFKIILIILLVSIFINILAMQRMEWISSYTPPDNNLKMDTCHYKIFENPITNYYLPLFLKFGPQSYVIGRIIGLDQDNWLGIHTNVLPFLNLIIVSLIILFIWKKEVYKYSKKHKKTIQAIVIIILLLFTLRIAFDKQITDYTRNRLHHFYEDRECKENFISKSLKPLYQGYVEESKEGFKEKYGYLPLIPYSLWVDGNLPVTIEKNTNWKRPDILLTKMHWSYGNATIVLYNNLSTDLPINLNFGIAAHRTVSFNKSFKIYLNEKEEVSLTAFPQKFTTYSINLNLKPGKNMIIFNGREGCNEILLCGDLLFRKIQIFNKNKNDLFYYGKKWIEDEHRYLERPKILMSNSGEIIMNSTKEFETNFSFKLYSNEINRTLEVYHNNKFIGKYVINNDFYYQNTITIPLKINKGINIIRFDTSQNCSHYKTPKNKTYCVSFIANIDYNKVISFY